MGTQGRAIRWYNDQKANDFIWSEDMKKTLIGLLAVLMAALWAPGPTLGNVEKSNNELVIPFELKGHLILIKCRINDSKETYDFVVDTGGRTFVDKTLADELQ
jgi:hypothetical protein